MAGQAPNQLPDYSLGFKAPMNPYMDQALQNAANFRAPQYTTVTNNLIEQAAQAGVQVRNPYDINVSNTYDPRAQQGAQFDPAKVQFEDTLAGYQPNMQAAQVAGHGFGAQDYSFTPDKVSAERLGPAERVQADRIGQIGNVYAQQIGPMAGLGFERVGAGMIGNPAANLNTFDIGAQERIYAPGATNYQMQGPADVTARDVTAGQWTDEGVRQKYMDPYMAAVVAEQQKNAQQIFDEQRAQAGGQAAAAGAFGGTRQAVLESAMRRDLANQQGGIAATGLQQAYQNAQQQYERDRGAGMQASLANQQAGLQAGLANQQMGFNTGQTNLQALISQGQFGAQQGMQAQMANQQNAQQIALANQQAQLQTQGLGVNTGLQAQLANQQYGLQAALANQAAGIDVGKFGQQQELQRLLANQQYGMQGSLANQQTELQRLMANQQYGLQGQMANQSATLETGKANQDAMLRAALANQESGLMAQLEGAKLGQSDRQYLGGLNMQQNLAQAQMQQEAGMLNTNLGFDALKTRYGGGLQAGLANQQTAMDAQRMAEQSRQWAANLGQQQTEFGANMNLQTQAAQQQFMNDIIRNNLAATGLSADIWGNVGNFETQSAQLGLQGNQQMGQFGIAQQQMEQDAWNQQYAHWMQQQAYPMNQAMALANMYGNAANTFGTQNTNIYTPKQSLGSQILGGVLAGVGAAGMAGGTGGLGTFAKWF